MSSRHPDSAVALCEKVPGLGLTLDPSHYTAGPHQGKNYDKVFPHVRHVHLRDTGKGPNQFQVRVGQGEIEYGRIVSQLARQRYQAGVTDILTVLDSQRSLLSLEDSLFNVRADRTIAFIQLYKALGGGWS